MNGGWRQASHYFGAWSIRSFRCVRERQRNILMHGLKSCAESWAGKRTATDGMEGREAGLGSFGLGSFASSSWPSGFRDGVGGLPCVGKKMLHVVVGIVSLVGIPDSVEKITLAGNGAALYVHAIDEAVLDFRSAPVAAPYESSARVVPGTRNRLSSKALPRLNGQCHKPARSDGRRQCEV